MPRSVHQQVLSKQREADCLKLRIESKTFEEIATDLGYASPAGAYKAYRRALDRIGREEAHEALILQYERLNAMIGVLWPKVEQGDLRAIRRALEVMHRIDQLFGLDQPQVGQRATTKAAPAAG
jgi:hypothetical protein